MSNQKMQTIWVCELEPVPPNSAGCWDWYLSFEPAFDHFNEYMEECDQGESDYQVGLYSVRLPVEWTENQIQTWLEDHTCIIPKYGE